MSKAGEIAVSQSLLFSAVISRLIRRCLTCTAMKKHWLNARTGGFYGVSKSNELTRQLRQAKLDKEELMAAEGDTTAQRTRELIDLLEDGPDFLDHPDTELCGALVAEIIVESNDTLRFRLHNGLELRESIERTVR